MFETTACNHLSPYLKITVKIDAKMKQVLDWAKNFSMSQIDIYYMVSA